MTLSAQDYPFPPPINAGPDTLPGGHIWATVEPSADPGLAFGMALPRGWGMEPDPGEKPQYPGHLARLALIGEQRESKSAVVQVSFTTVPFDLHLYDWMQLTAKAFSIEPINWRVTPGPSGREIVEMLGLTGPAKDRHVTRTLCQADAGRIVVLLAMAPVSRYAVLAETFARVAGSFALTKPSRPGELEPWSVAATTSPGFRLMYPHSWTARVPQSPVPGKSAIEILLAADGDVAGYIRIKGIDPKIVTDDPQRTFQLAMEELAEAGVKFESDWQELADPLLAQVTGFGMGKCATGRMAKGPSDLRIALVEREGLHYCGTLLAPSPEESPAEWMRAKFAFLLAMASAGKGTG